MIECPLQNLYLVEHDGAFAIWNFTQDSVAEYLSDLSASPAPEVAVLLDEDTLKAVSGGPAGLLDHGVISVTRHTDDAGDIVPFPVSGKLRNRRESVRIMPIIYQ